MINTVETYTGWKKWTPTLDEFAKFCTEPYMPVEMQENEYLLVYTESERTKKLELTGHYVVKHGKLQKVSRDSISFKSRKSSEKTTTIYPRNDEQICAVNLLKDQDVTIKLLTGTWGTGKTMFLVSAALRALDSALFERIVWIRNNVRVANTEDLGALPGEVNEKLMPYLGPFIDHCGKAGVECMLNNGKLVIEPLQSLRGRNLENTLILCSEAENLTTEHIQLIIARAAEGSEVWLDADTRQRDKVVFEHSKGIENLIEALAGEELFGYVHLTKSERSKTAALADKLNRFVTKIFKK